MPEILDTDVLVIGGGGAGCRAALAAHEAGVDTTILTKGWFGFIGFRGSGATGCGICYRWGFSTRRGYPGDPQKERKVNINDILQAGLGMADPKLARVMVENSTRARQDLERWGLVLYKESEESHSRCEVLVMPALAHLVRASDIHLRDHTMITDLIVQDGRCVGAVGINEETGDTCIFRAKNTIVATGGNSSLFKLNCHPGDTLGDGHAMGYKAGAELINMEFLQSFLGVVYPTRNIVDSSWCWLQHPKITNAMGEEFLPNYLPAGATVEQCLEQRGIHNPFSTRDSYSRYLDIAIIKEVLAGRGTPHQGCYVEGLNLNKIPALERAWLEYRGVDPGGCLEVSCLHQCCNGGMYINELAQTTVLGLYAVGEVSAGMHGADRLGGHMMVSSQVFGRLAGEHAAATAKEISLAKVSEDTMEPALKRLEKLRGAKGNLKPREIFLGSLGQDCWAKMMVLRSERSLREILAEIERIRAEDLPRISLSSTMELVQAVELENMLVSAEMVARGALLRQESRGGHYREDYPKRDDNNWLKVISIRNIDGEMGLIPKVIDANWEEKPSDLCEWRWG